MIEYRIPHELLNNDSIQIYFDEDTHNVSISFVQKLKNIISLWPNKVQNDYIDLLNSEVQEYIFKPWNNRIKEEIILRCLILTKEFYEYEDE